MAKTTTITKKEIMDVLVNNPDMTASEILGMTLNDHSLIDELYAAEQKRLPLHLRDANRTITEAIKRILSATHFPKSASEISRGLGERYNINTTPNKVVAIMKSMYGDDLNTTVKEVNVTTKRKVKMYSI